MSTKAQHLLTCPRIAGVAVALTSFVAAGIAQPAGAAKPPAAEPASSVIAPTTPGCLVGAALLLPLVLGMVLVLNPVALPQAAGNYWTGGELGLGQGTFPGFLQQCGLITGVGGGGV